MKRTISPLLAAIAIVVAVAAAVLWFAVRYRAQEAARGWGTGAGQTQQGTGARGRHREVLDEMRGRRSRARGSSAGDRDGESSLASPGDEGASAGGRAAD